LIVEQSLSMDKLSMIQLKNNYKPENLSNKLLLFMILAI